MDYSNHPDAHLLVNPKEITVGALGAVVLIAAFWSVAVAVTVALLLASVAAVGWAVPRIQRAARSRRDGLLAFAGATALLAAVVVAVVQQGQLRTVRGEVAAYRRYGAEVSEALNVRIAAERRHVSLAEAQRTLPPGETASGILAAEQKLH